MRTSSGPSVCTFPQEVLLGHSASFYQWVNAAWHNRWLRDANCPHSCHCTFHTPPPLQASLAPFLQNRTTGGVALYDVALHKNLGDAVLWAAAAKLVPSFHESVKYMCAQSQFPGKGAEARKHFPKCNVKAMLKAIGPNGVVLLAPGGNWGDLWWFVHSQRLG